MTRVVLLLAAIAILTSGKGQQLLKIKATYTATLNLHQKSESVEVEHGELRVAGPRSLFLFFPSDSLKENEVNVENDEFGNPVMKMKIPTQDSLGQRYFLDQAGRKCISRELLYHNGNSQAFIIEEDLKPIPWALLQEFRQIGQFRCQKAVGRFRGRTYSAWFATAIPVPSGPWKLSGLPGLILEAYDEERAVHFQCRSIEFPYLGALDVSPPTDGQSISMQEYVERKAKTVDDFVNYLLSKLPRGATVEISEVSGQDAELEREFEFDHEKGKN